MKPGFYTIMAAQFFSSLADNALLIAAIALLRDLQEPAWMTPALKQSFVLAYVLLAPLAGPFADSMAKGRVMLATNAIKIVGCGLMLFTNIHPLYLLREFSHCVSLLWTDRLGQISLATTTLFWGAGATLQFIVIEWASRAFGLDLSRSTYMMAVVMVGIALGAVIAARFVTLRG